MNFKDLELLPVLCTTLEKKGYEIPTPIQVQAIPPILEGRDILGCAQTGTGKTAAFALPILQRLSKTSDRLFSGQVRSLILAPTRELANQVYESFAAYGSRMGLRMAVVYGGVGYYPQITKLKRGLDVLVATPGRLLDLMNRDALVLSAVEIFTLDEADRMLDMGFLPDIKRVTLELPPKRQTLFFSATMPGEILSFANSLLDNPVNVQVKADTATADNIEQRVYFIDRNDRHDLLCHVLSKEEVSRMLIFTRTKYGADKLARKLGQNGVYTEVIHGDKSQNARQKSLSKFKKGSAQVLVATDVASRGIDVDNISHVVNYDLPDSPETYVHRIGRTARAGASGISMSFCDKKDRFIIRDIERMTKVRLTPVASPLKRGSSEKVYDNTPRKPFDNSDYQKKGTESSSSVNNQERSYGQDVKRENSSERRQQNSYRSGDRKSSYSENSRSKLFRNNDRKPSFSGNSRPGNNDRKPYFSGNKREESFKSNEKKTFSSSANTRKSTRDDRFGKSKFVHKKRDDFKPENASNENTPWWERKKYGISNKRG